MPSTSTLYSSGPDCSCSICQTIHSLVEQCLGTSICSVLDSSYLI